MSRYNGESSISLSVSKQSVANTVKVAEAVLLEVNKLKAEYPDINMEVAMDQSEFINKSISNVVSSAVGGGLLAIIILFLFLRNIRSTFIVGIAIPVSIVTTFALMYFADLSINLISLGGLTLGVGMLVDNSIVVLENIYRLAEEEGYQMERAAMGDKASRYGSFCLDINYCSSFPSNCFRRRLYGDYIQAAFVYSYILAFIVACSCTYRSSYA